MQPSIEGKFRKKPVVIDAARIDRILLNASRSWSDLPAWVIAAYEEGSLVFGRVDLSIHTLEGVMRGAPEDWLIRGVQGELYPCKPAIFAETYEAVE